MEGSEEKPLFTKELNENLDNDQLQISQKNLKKNLTVGVQFIEKSKFNNIEYNNNDDDYLDINSKYQTSNINNNNFENEKRTDSIEKKSTSNSSSSQNENNTPIRNGISNNYILNLNYYKNEQINKKNLSPICIYYEGIDKYLSEQNSNPFDYSKTNNYIEKNIYFNNYFQNEYGIVYYPYDYGYERLRTYSFENNEFNVNKSLSIKKANSDIIPSNNNVDNSNIENNDKEKKAFSNSNTPSFKKYGGKFDIPLYYYNYDSGMMRGIQSANLFCNNNFINNINQNKNENQTNETLINNNSNKNQKIYFNKGKKGRPFTERSGDWVCANCRNLNFAFRIICNRCHLPKIESEKFVNGKFEKVNNSPNENNYKYSNPPKDDNTDNSIIDVININDKK
jgi:hypothetical protein